MLLVFIEGGFYGGTSVSWLRENMQSIENGYVGGKYKMKLKWTEEEIKYFDKKVPVAERNDDWVIWTIIMVASLSGIAYMIYNVIMK